MTHSSNNHDNFCLKWDKYRESVTSTFHSLMRNGDLVDVTFYCEGQKLQAHQIILSACSPFLKDVLKENPCKHPVFFMNETRHADMAAILEFMYCGFVNISQNQLASFIQTADRLQIRGLSGDEEAAGKDSAVAAESDASGTPVAVEPSTPAPIYRKPQTDESFYSPSTSGSSNKRFGGDVVESDVNYTGSVGGDGVSGAGLQSSKRRRRRSASSVVSPSPPTLAPPPNQQQLSSHVKLEQTEELPPPPQLHQQMMYQGEGDQQLYDVGENTDPVLSSTLPDTGLAGPSLSALDMESHLSPGMALDESNENLQNEELPCPYCGAFFPAKKLACHVRVHRDPVPCPLCGSQSSRLDSLRRHMMLVHGFNKEQINSYLPYQRTSVTGVGDGHSQQQQQQRFGTAYLDGTSPPAVLVKMDEVIVNLDD